MAYDIMMHAADAVLSGGVRRSATCCLFSPDDDDMMNAKTGNWFIDNRQRARSNNSVVLIREETDLEYFKTIFNKIREFGEPGFFFVEDKDFTTNPCFEIGFKPQTDDGRSGWQGCNLTEGNGAACTTSEKFYSACESLSFFGTLQAGFTNFPYLGETTEEIFKREALLGCSFTGWMANPQVMLNPEVMEKGAEIVKSINAEVAEIIGINQSARTTCSKPSGNSGVLLKSPSGCHGDHSPLYFRLMQINKISEIGKYLLENHSYLIEESVWSSNKTDYVAYIPVISNKNAKFKSELRGINQLEVVKLIQRHWVNPGTNVNLCVDPRLKHSVSNTVEVDNYDDVCQWLFDNKDDIAAASFLPAIGDKIYEQAPFTSILTIEKLIENYGPAAILASGLIVDGLDAFDERIWLACDYVKNRNMQLEGTRKAKLIQRDWIRRAKQFAKRYFKNDIDQMILCLKDIYLYHKWVNINRELKNKSFDFTSVLTQPAFANIDSTGGIACSGPNGCEIPEDFLNGILPN